MFKSNTIKRHYISLLMSTSETSILLSFIERSIINIKVLTTIFRLINLRLNMRNNLYKFYIYAYLSCSCIHLVPFYTCLNKYRVKSTKKDIISTCKIIYTVVYNNLYFTTIRVIFSMTINSVSIH